MWVNSQWVTQLSKGKNEGDNNITANLDSVVGSVIQITGKMDF